MRSYLGTLKSAIIVTNLWIISHHIRGVSGAESGDLYASVDELWTNWARAKKPIIDLLEKHIKEEESRLNKLHDLHDFFRKSLDYEASRVAEEKKVEQLSDESKRIRHPVGAFVTLNRLIGVLDEIESFYDQEYNWKSEFLFLKEIYSLPSNEDRVGSGEALLRLLDFYDLDMYAMTSGKLAYNQILELHESREIVENGPKMESEDCFELGKIAYENGQYVTSIQWFEQALKLLRQEDLEMNLDRIFSPFGVSSQVRHNELLEYVAFAAFKANRIKFAAQITRLWLEKDPTNERAKGNLEYYEEELGKHSHELELKVDISNDNNKFKFDYDRSESSPYPHLSKQTDTSPYNYSPGEKFSPTHYVISEDKVVRQLCRRSSAYTKLSDQQKGSCTKKMIPMNNQISPEIKIEVLHSSPEIIRLYDIITEQEANHLRELAMPRLRRSTVQSKEGLVTTDFRIAKTAWLSLDSDPVVARIESRLSEILELNFDKSEDLQVVNYGLGGFYGPHLDSARETNATNNYSSSVPIHFLKSNDRLATILIYLNQVEAGGATVFPRLNLTADPIERSAIVWYNLLKNGLTDERTLHTGCPVLLGSKWIATKWPREEANCFLRPCALKREL